MSYRSEAEMRAAQGSEGYLGTETPQNDNRRSAGRSEGASDLAMPGWSWVRLAALLVVCSVAWSAIIALAVWIV